jgi:hypothetical protein
VDLVNWFERNMNQKPKGVGVAAIEGLEKTLGCELPPGLSLLLEMGGGDFWFYEKQALSADAIADAADKLDEGVVPFASDVDGNLYVCDINRRDAVFEWDSDGRGTEVCSVNRSKSKCPNLDSAFSRPFHQAFSFKCIHFSL